jgi:hypothetical protein
VVLERRGETEGRALDVIPCPVWVVLDAAKVFCGRSGEEWESLRFLEEKVLVNESLHSRRFLGRGVVQSIESCIPGDPPCVRGVVRKPGENDQGGYSVFSRLLTRHRILYDRRR